MDFLTADRKKSYLLLMLAIHLLSCFFYAFLPSGAEAFPPFFIVYSIQFLAFGITLWLLRSESVNLDMRWIVGLAILMRSILLFTDPVLENDYWRYLWDGRVLAHGINPYEFKPLDRALDHLEVAYRHQIGWKEFGTIYPPFSIGVFAFAHLIAPDSLLGLKVILTLFDLATGWLVLAWLRNLSIQRKWSILYFLNPLVLKEVSNSGHLDSIAVFFSVLAALLLWMSQEPSKPAKTSLGAWIALAFAVASKLYPLCFLPVFIKTERKRWRGLAAFCVTLLVFYFPILILGSRAWNGTEAFARHWIFNASLYRIFQNFSALVLTASGGLDTWGQVARQDDLMAKFMSAISLTLFLLYRARKMTSAQNLSRELLWAIGALLLLSPVLNAWYVLWLLPFACVDRNLLWLSFAYLVVASYSWWYSPDLALYLRWAEYAIFFLLLGASVKTKKIGMAMADSL